MTLADYLAKNYLSADTTTKSRKRKRKDKAQVEGVIIEDNDESWKQPTNTGEDDDEDAPTIVGGTLSGGLNRPVKKSKWIKIGSDAPRDSEQAAADAILADAAAESRNRAQADDDDPMMVDEDGAEVSGPTMASGAAAGLQTAAEVTIALNKKRKAEMKAMRESDLDMGGLAQQTIYRDASGRMINVKEKKEEAEAKAKEDARKAKEEEESRKGDVQRREKERRREEFEEAKVMTFARGADDEKMNDELKERERWNDPMAQLLATTKSSKKKGKSKGGGKTYQGAFEPNRYGIRPGWRWDGVDRSNGFEKKWFAARNAKQNRAELEYMWQLDE